MAAVFGERYGHYRWSIGSKVRSLEGSIAMLFFSWLTTSIALFAMPYLVGKPLINWMMALIYGGVVAIVCTLVEALSPWGTDNLTIPAAAVLILHLLRN